MSSSQKTRGSAHVIIVICLVVALLGSLGFVFYQNVIQKGKSSDSNASSSSQTNTTATTTGTTVSLRQFTSQKYLIRFNYPSAWSVSELIQQDQADWYASTVTVRNDKGVIVAELGTGGQFGGACDPAAAFVKATTLIDVTVTAKGLSTAHYGYTIVQREDGKFETIYGLNKGDLAIGEKSVQCSGMSIGYHYIVNTENSPVGAITFGAWNAGGDFTAGIYTTFDEAKAYATSSEMTQVQQMITSISVGE